MQDELRQQNIAALLARGLSRTRKKNGLPASEPPGTWTVRSATPEPNSGKDQSVTDSAAKTLGQQQDIRPDTILLESKERTGASVSRLYFIENQ